MSRGLTHFSNKRKLTERTDSIGTLATSLITTTLLIGNPTEAPPPEPKPLPTIPTVEALAIANKVAPNASKWRQHNETLTEENERLRAEIERLKETKEAKAAEKADAEWQTFTATAYTSDCYGCIGITKTGVDVSDTVTYKGRRVIAVDPSVIPLGSTVEIRLADGTTFEATAQDTGGGINGKEIDILKNTEAMALDFGRQEVGVRILK